MNSKPQQGGGDLPLWYKRRTTKKESLDISYDEFRIFHPPLASGAFGCVYRGIFHDEVVAIKEIHLVHIDNEIHPFISNFIISEFEKNGAR